jgi:Tfp pilus assembly protein FimV
VALRREDLAPGPGAVVYRFPADVVRRRARRKMMLRRRVTLSAAVFLVVAATLAGGGVAGTAPTSRAPRSVAVRPGDTLWAIAGEFAPEGTDPREYVDALIELNGLSGGLQAGTRLRLPN